MNPYALLTAGGLWLVSLIGVGYWQNSAGHTAERDAWQARENVQLVNANAKIIELNEVARKAERDHAERLATVSARLEQEKKHEAAKRDKIIADLRAGFVRLRDPGATSLYAIGGQGGTVTATTGKCDAGTGGELSVETAEFLVRLAGEADEIVDQLHACQDTVRSDRGLSVPGGVGEKPD